MSSDASLGSTHCHVRIPIDLIAKLVPRFGCWEHYLDVSFPKTFGKRHYKVTPGQPTWALGTGNFLLNLGGDSSGDFPDITLLLRTTLALAISFSLVKISPSTSSWARESTHKICNGKLETCTASEVANGGSHPWTSRLWSYWACAILHTSPEILYTGQR